MPKVNPMLKALDQELARLQDQRRALESRIDTVNQLRAQLSGLVRKRPSRAKPRAGPTAPGPMLQDGKEAVA